MPRIYSQAASVIIWIHEYDSHLRYAFRYLRQLLNAAAESQDGPICTLFDPIGWVAVRRLMQCDWFHRRWVVQEAVMAKHALVLCGAEVMSLHELLRGVDVAVSALIFKAKRDEATEHATVGSIRHLHVLRKLRQSNTGQGYQKLLWLLENLRRTRETSAHDQIYGLLGFCSPAETAGNPIQYHRNMEEVYKSCVMTHTRLYDNFEFLSLHP